MQICYVISSEEGNSYAEMAYISASLVRRLYPRARILLLTDDRTERVLSREGAAIRGLVDQVLAVKVEADSPVVRSRLLKVTMRRHVRGPFLFLDSDTTPVARFSGVCNGSYDLSAALDRHRSMYPCFPKLADEHYRRFNWRSPLPRYFNSGVIYWSDSPVAHAVGEQWHRRWRMIYDATGDHRDQPAFNSAIDAVGARVMQLPPRFNAMVEASPWLAWNGHIFHFYTSLGMPRRGTLLHHLLQHLHRTGEIDWDTVGRAARWRSPWVDDSGAVVRPWLNSYARACRDLAERPARWLRNRIQPHLHTEVSK